MIIKEVYIKGSPCQLTYTMKKVLDGLGDVQDEPTKVVIRRPLKNIHIETYVKERYARDIYLYYRKAEYIKEENAYLCYTNYEKVPYPSTIVRVKNGYIEAELITYRFVDDSTLEL